MSNNNTSIQLNSVFTAIKNSLHRSPVWFTCLGVACLGVVCLGMACLGVACLGVACLDVACLGVACLGFAGILNTWLGPLIVP